MKSLKRIMMVAILATLFTGMANAQFRFGLKAGLNVNKIDFNHRIPSTDDCTGWTAGLMTEFTIPVVGICFDASLMYSRMNNGNDEIESLDIASYGKNFINIPINIKYKLNLPAVAAIVKPYIFTGPDFAFKLDGNKKDFLKTRTYQMAWNVGLGVELIRHLQISGSYAFGCNNIIRSYVPDALGTYENIKGHNNYWTVSAAWLF